MKLISLGCVLLCLVCAQAVGQEPPIGFRLEKRPFVGEMPPELVKMIRPEEGFALAFMEEPATHDWAIIHVNFSTDGRSWKTGDYPAYSGLRLRQTSGVGLCASGTGIVQRVVYNHKGADSILITNGSNTTQSIAWLPLVWVPTPTRTPASDAPSCLILPTGEQLVAVNSGGAVLVYSYDGNLQFYATDTIAESATGRPALVALPDGRAMISWRESSGGCLRIVTKTGQRVQVGSYNLVVFFDRRMLDLPAGQNLSSCVSSDPAVATDGQRIYLLVIHPYESPGEGELPHSYRPVVYQSTDGISWAEHSRPTLSVGRMTKINLAVKNDGTMLAVKVKKVRTKSYLDAELYSRDQSGSWAWEIVRPDTPAPPTNADPWRGVHPSYRQFGLIRYGY